MGFTESEAEILLFLGPIVAPVLITRRIALEPEPAFARAQCLSSAEFA